MKGSQDGVVATKHLNLSPLLQLVLPRIWL